MGGQNLVSIKFFYGQDFLMVECQNPFLVRIVCWVIIFLELYWKNSRCNFWLDQLSFVENILQGSKNFGVKTFFKSKICFVKNFWANKIVWSTFFLGSKNFWIKKFLVKKMFRSKFCWSKFFFFVRKKNVARKSVIVITFWSGKFVGLKMFWSEPIFGRKKFLVRKKILVGKIFWLENYFGRQK